MSKTYILNRVWIGESIVKIVDNYENYYFENIVNIITKELYPNSFPMHWHKYVEMIALLHTEPSDTQASIKVNQEIYVLKPGDLLFVWPGELHEIIDNNSKQLIAIQFPISVISEVRDFTSYMNIFRNYHLLYVTEYRKLSLHIIKLLEEMVQLQQDAKPFMGVEILIRLYNVFMHLGNYINEHGGIGGNKASRTNQIVEKIQHICTYIQENCDQDITLDQISKLSGFSSYYFSRSFKQATTFNFVEYLSLQRVKRVQSLLIDSNIPITEAAYQAGFKSLSSFNRVFRHYNGCSPSEYKKYYNE